jgi:hypothetical protein
MLVVALAACEGGDAASPVLEETPTESTSPSPAATVDDFHSEWCAAVLPYGRILEDLPTLDAEPRMLRGLDQAVERLDALSVALDDAELDVAAEKVRVLADRVADQADILDQAGAPTFQGFIETLDEQAAAVKAVGRALDPAVEEMGRC